MSVLRANPDPATRLTAAQKLVDTFDEKLCAPLFERLARNHTWQDPTLVQTRAVRDVLSSASTSDPRLAYVPPSVRAVWNPKNPTYWHGDPAGRMPFFRKVYDVDVRMVRAMDRAGVPLLAGSDSGNPYVYPGFALHEELALLVEAGLSPLRALEAATLSPAKYFAIESTNGTIEAGKIADLVLLDADPLASIENTRHIRAVVRRGELLERAELDRMLAEAAADVAAMR
jgi:hypothetical protein